mmetsp:Transcript_74494/g.134257  ORF Transcript_74494/g.134257 Transcript_74494/m.134257 type:complete len:575 (-) Transcript_74494:50-1774(-)
MQGGPVALSTWHPGALSSQRDPAIDSSRRFSNSAADGSAADAGASGLQMQGGPVASPTWHPGALSSQRAPARASQLPSLSLSQARMFLASGMIDLKLVRPSVSGFTVPLAAKRAPSDQSETESRRMSFELASQQLDGLRGLFGDTDSSATEGEDEGGALGGGALMREPESSGVSRALITTPERLDLAIAGSKVGAGLADQVQPEDRGTRKGSNQDRKSDRSQSHSKKKQRVTSKDGSAETPFWARSSIDFADESLEDSQSMDEDNIAARDKLLVDMKEALLDAEEERTLWRTQVRLLLSLEPRMAPGPAEMSFKLSLEWRDAQVRKLFHDITKLEVKQRLARRVARQQRGMARILRKSIQDSQNSCLFSGRSGLKAESSVITDCTSVTFGSLAADSLTAGSSYMPEASQEQKNKRAHKGRPKPRVLGTRLDTLLDEKSAMCHVTTKRPLHPKVTASGSLRASAKFKGGVEVQFWGWEQNDFCFKEKGAAMAAFLLPEVPALSPGAAAAKARHMAELEEERQDYKERQDYRGGAPGGELSEGSGDFFPTSLPEARSLLYTPSSQGNPWPLFGGKP